MFEERVEHCPACAERTPHKERLSVAWLLRADPSRRKWRCLRCRWKKMVAKRTPSCDRFLDLVMSRNPFSWS